ncbi:zinc ribbon domain-containing protein [Candidatus Dependentiae bacterium]|nr:zinc ribbon domain-containing protein [Candidatus Dependentiae bacterium]
MAMIKCKECGKEISDSVSTCPNCGKKLKTSKLKLGCLTLIGLIIFIAIITSLQSGSEEKELLEKLKNAPIEENIDYVNIYNHFKIMSDHTDIQRENLINELNNKKIKWIGTVYEVTKLENGYIIQTSGDDDEKEAGSFITVDATKSKYIETLKTGDRIRAIGIFRGTTARNINLNPAYLLEPNEGLPIRINEKAENNQTQNNANQNNEIPPSTIAGKYILKSEEGSDIKGEMEILITADNKVSFSIEITNDVGVGEIAKDAIFIGNSVVYEMKNEDNGEVEKVKISFNDNIANVETENCRIYHGFGMSFNGEYIKQ